MTNKSLWRIGADIPRKARNRLLQMFPPFFANTHCTVLTHAFRVPDTFSFPKQKLDVVVYGYHRGDDHEALLVSVCGSQFRPDGKRYFIALSVAPGVEPGRCAEIDSDSIVYLDEPVEIEGLTLRRFPLWNRQPEQRKAA